MYLIRIEHQSREASGSVIIPMADYSLCHSLARSIVECLDGHTRVQVENDHCRILATYYGIREDI